MVGPSSLLMTAAATPYVKWLSTAAAQAAQTGVQAYAAAAYEAAFAMTVAPPVIADNQAQLITLIATNFFGRTPRRSRPPKPRTWRCGRKMPGDVRLCRCI